MTATVITLWHSGWEKRIRIPGPGEDTFDAEVIILPVIHRKALTNPPRDPRTNRRKTP